MAHRDTIRQQSPSTSRKCSRASDLQLLPLIVLFACSARTPAPTGDGAHTPPVRDLEFLHVPVLEVTDDPDGGAWLVLGPHSRNFRIDPQFSPDAEAMASFARTARTDGTRVHATIWMRDRLHKSPENLHRGRPALVLWLAADPDPRRP